MLKEDKLFYIGCPLSGIDWLAFSSYQPISKLVELKCITRLTTTSSWEVNDSMLRESINDWSMLIMKGYLKFRHCLRGLKRVEISLSVLCNKMVGDNGGALASTHWMFEYDTIVGSLWVAAIVYACKCWLVAWVYASGIDVYEQIAVTSCFLIDKTWNV